MTMKQCEWPLFKYNAAIQYLDKRLQYGFISKAEYDTRKEKFREQISSREQLVEQPETQIFCSANSKYMMRYECIMPLSKVFFEGHEFFAPNNPDEFLTKVYKDYMTLPPEEQRVPHYSNVVFL
jgi:phosphorylcholine metabolism protein LicD